MWQMWVKRIGITFGLTIFSGSIYQFVATKIDQKKYPVQGHLVDIGGYKLNINCTGIGEQTVILDSGLGGISLSWALVQPEIAKFARVCSYDRAGYGWSDVSPMERTSQMMVEELHNVLTKADIKGPYILVGHSLGGMNIRLFAATYPAEVTGLVLVDSSHEHQLEKLPVIPTIEKLDLLAKSDVLPILAFTGVSRLLMQLSQTNKAFPLNIQQAHSSTTRFFKTMRDESVNFAKSCQQLQKTDVDISAKPLTVITAGRSGLGSLETKEWRVAFELLQKDLVSKSKQGKQVVAQNSSHNIPGDQPDIIVDAVRDMVVKCGV